MPSPEPFRLAWRFLYGAFGLCGMTWLLYGTQTATYDLVVTGKAVFADARSISEVSLRSAHPIRRWLNQHGWLLPSAYTLELDANAQEVLGVRTWARKDGAWLIQAGTRAGRLPVTLWRHHGDEKHFITQDEIRYGHNHADRDEDGLPDIIELRTENARAAFSSWFTNIAEAQATRIDDRWASIHQDCAGLVRFAYREAMRAHDRAWLAKWQYLPAMPAARRGQYTYPDLPIVGDLPFRARGGAYDPGATIQSQFSAAPNARTLWQHNTTFTSKDVAQARAGDLLFFHVPDADGSRLHTMIALGDMPAATHHAKAARVVYHTGQAPPDGEVRLVSLEKLQNHPDPSWHPVPDNPRFIGVHRLSHLVFDAQTNTRFAWDSHQRSHP